jgi:flagellar L-ring protein precursor FlgH
MRLLLLKCNHAIFVNRTQHIALLVTILICGLLLHNAINLKAQSNPNIASLFADQRARQVGDIITILIVEYSSASSQASTSSQKESDHGVSATGGQRTQAYMPLYGLRGQIKNGYDNEAATTRKGSLKGKITAQITDVTDNGNFIISGSREVIINGEKEATVISGVVRPEDISGLNTVYSYNVSDLKISYKGAGEVHKGQRPGLIDKILNWIF